MAGSTVANKAGGFWLGTFVFAFIEVSFILFVRKTGVKGQNGCAPLCGRGGGACVRAAAQRRRVRGSRVPQRARAASRAAARHGRARGACGQTLTTSCLRAWRAPPAAPTQPQVHALHHRRLLLLAHVRRAARRGRTHARRPRLQCPSACVRAARFAEK
jgi:hypothetical protein